MFVTTVMVRVDSNHIEDFIEASIANHRASIKEPGNVRFDVLQSEEDPSRFVLYEAYQTKEDSMAHKKTAHYEKWRDTVAGWMAQPRKGIPYKGIVP
jgi:(4S)-4-hydroxy-5-phosphonooxypentane-2,3-dione isomerase